MRRSGPLRRTPLARSTSTLTRYCTIPAVSAKRRRDEARYRVLRAAFLDGLESCQYPTGCHAAAVEVHHRRGRVGALYLRVDLWSGLCSHHHRYVTEHPAEAVRLGISELRNGETT
jgi:hypothetical protein